LLLIVFVTIAAVFFLARLAFALYVRPSRTRR
jgi:hypothetical protein